jgi:hypothetical protein
MRSDSTVMHSENIGPVVGEFYGTEIREVNLIDVELREISDAQQRARYFLAEEKPVLELLPDEVVVDGIIRKTTTKEVTDAQLSV